VLCDSCSRGCWAGVGTPQLGWRCLWLVHRPGRLQESGIARSVQMHRGVPVMLGGVLQGPAVA
jgi:hypothetical protein